MILSALILLGGGYQESSVEAPHPGGEDLTQGGSTEAVRIYAPVEFDTTRVERSVAIENGEYALRIVSSSRNDSSVVNDRGKETMVEHDHGHTITLVGYEGADQKLELHKWIFKDGLDADFFQRARLYLVNYASIRSNALYLDAFMGVPETDYVQPFEIQWFFRGPRKGTMRLRGLPMDEVQE